MANVDIIIRTIDQTKSGFSAISGSLTKIAAAAGTLTTAMMALKAAFDAAGEGARLERLADAGAEIARQYGGNMDLIVQKTKEASLGTVSEMDIISSANRAMMLGLGADAEQLANLMEIAAFRGRAMGVDTTKAFSDIVTGIGRASPMILDNLGIVISAKDTYDNYAKSLGKSSSELTKAEKTQAILNAVLAEGNNLLTEAGGLVEDNASQYEKLQARIEDYQNSVKQTLNTAITPSLEAFLDLSDAMDEASEATGRTDQRSRVYLGALTLQAKQEQELKDRINDTNTARLEGLAALYETNNARKADIELTDEEIELRKEAQEAWQEELETRQEFWQKEADARSNFLEGVLSSAETLFDSQNEYKTELEETIAKYGEGSDEVMKLKDAHAEALGQMQYDLLLAKLSVDGLTQAEFNMAVAAGEAFGVFDEEAANAILAQDALTTAVANGQLSFEQYGDMMKKAMEDGIVSAQELQAMIDAIPGSKTVVVTFEPQGYEGFGGGFSYATGDLAYQNPPKKPNAIGGTFTVPMSYGNEGFMMSNNVTASGGETVTISRDSDPNAKVVEAIYSTRINYDELAHALMTAVQQSVK